MADLYQLLGVSRSATADEIKRAYRRRARELHPDANPDPQAEDDFKELARAYEVLSNPELRARYDQFGEAGITGAGAATDADPFFASGLNDFLDAFLRGSGSPFGGTRGPSGPPRGQHLEVVADITFEEAVFGVNVPVTVRTAVACAHCGGSGAAPGTRPTTCMLCAGTGQVRQRQNFMMMTARICSRCGGSGQVIPSPCPTCRGEGRYVEDRTYNVDVPPGVDNGSTLRLPNRGAVGPRGGPAGDLYVHLRVTPHEQFVRDGYDLITQVPISF